MERVHELDVEEKEREARQVAERCVAFLKDRYGAKRVVVFGSLRGDGLWHEGSDLDLAVEGLTPKEFWQAWEELVPSWLRVDLIPLERAYPEVRARILGESPVPEDPYLALKARIEDELCSLERICQGMREALERAGEAPEEYDVRAVATYVDDFYTGCERLFEQVAVQLDGNLPGGADWHLKLQRQMTRPVPEVRPACISAELAERLDPYRRFRHRVRHRYGFELDWEPVRELAEGMPALLAELRVALREFGRWLESQGADKR